MRVGTWRCEGCLGLVYTLAPLRWWADGGWCRFWAWQGTHRVRTVEGVFVLQGHNLLPQRLDLALGALLQFRQRGARP